MMGDIPIWRDDLRMEGRSGDACLIRMEDGSVEMAAWIIRSDNTAGGVTDVQIDSSARCPCEACARRGGVQPQLHRFPGSCIALVVFVRKHVPVPAGTDPRLALFN